MTNEELLTSDGDGGTRIPTARKTYELLRDISLRLRIKNMKIFNSLVLSGYGKFQSYLFRF